MIFDQFTLLNICREIINGIGYLRRDGFYHGNLSWETTLYKHSHIVKLCNSKIKSLIVYSHFFNV